MATGNIDKQDSMLSFDGYSPEPEDEGDESGMSLMDHLEELRWRIFKTLIAIAVGSIAAFFFRGYIVSFLEQPLPLHHQTLFMTGITESFTVFLMISIAAGFVVALPVVLYQTWAFVSPGLYEKEKKYAVPFIFIGVILFLAGIALGYVVLKYPVEFLVTFGGSEFTSILTASSYFGFISFFILAFGVIFEMPLVLTFLAYIDVITSKTLQAKRAPVHVGMWIAATIVIPGADPYSPVILGASMSILYEMSILFIKFLKK